MNAIPLNPDRVQPLSLRDRLPGPEGGREAVLFADTFNTWFEPENSRAAGLKPAARRVWLLLLRPLCLL